MKQTSGMMLYYKDLRNIRTHLTVEEAGQLFFAICDYGMDNREFSSDNSLLDLAFGLLKDAIDRDRESYQKRCERNRKNVESRWNKEVTPTAESAKTDVLYDDTAHLAKVLKLDVG